MGIAKIIGWTAACLVVGFMAGTYEISGRTPAQHVERLWKTSVPSPKAVKAGAEGLVADVKHTLTPEPPRPTERHSTDDKVALQKLIAKHQQ